MAPTLVTAYAVNNAARDFATLTTPSFTPSAGEVIVVTAFTGDSPATIGACTNTGTAQTWTTRSNTSTTNNCSAAMFTTTVGASPGAITVSVAFAGTTANAHSMVVSRWSSAQLAASPVVTATQNVTTGQGTLTTVAADSVIVWGIGDWNAVAPGTPTYVSSATQLAAPFTSATFLTTYAAYQAAVTTGSKTFGVSAPTGQKDALLAIELQPTSFTVADPAVGTDTRAVSAAVTGADPGTGTDSGGIALGFAGTDTATGTEAFLISTPIVGNEPGAGDDSAAQVTAATTGSDSGTGTDSSTVGTDTTGADTATGAESGSIQIAATDTATGAEAQSSTAQVTGTNPGTGADGGFYDTAFGDLNLSLWAVDRTTGNLSPLPDFLTLTVSPVRNAPGAITVAYPATGLNYSLLHNNITADCDLEVEIWLSGSQTGRLRGYLTDTAIDDAAEATVATFSGSFLELRMGEVLVFPQPLGGANANAKLEAVFNAATAGGVMSTLLTQAQARGALTDITKDFTNTVDSRGVTWPTVVTTKFSPGATYASVLDTLVSLGLCEWQITADHVLHLYVSGGRGTDRTTGPKPVILRRGRNIVDAPRKHSVRTSATTVLAAGAEGIYAPVSDASALSRRGRRVEAAASANNLTNLGSVQAFAGVELAAVSPGAMEITHGLGFLPGEPRPGTVFDVGDWVFSDTIGSLERRRVAQWTLTVGGSSGATPTGSVTLNDTTTDAVSALHRLLNRATNGSAVVGTSTSSVDTGVPTPPTGVVASSTAYFVGRDVLSSVTVGWAAPILNVDGSVITDLAGYAIQYAVGTGPYVPAVTIANGSATSGSFTAAPGQTIHIQVRAYDQAGNSSAWTSPATDHTTASDATAPAVTSTPTVSNYLGVLKIAWDGKTSTGADMLAASPDFNHVEVHLSTASGFTPTPSTYFDQMFAAGVLVYASGVYGTTYYAKLVSVDGSGNKSVGSAQGSAAPAQVVSLDVFDGAIGTAKLADAAITTAKINDLAVNNAKIGDLSVGKLTAGILSVAVTLSGIIRTGTTFPRAEMDGAGFRLYNSGGTNTVNLSANDGSFYAIGEYRTALSGQRMIVNPNGTAADTMRLYPSGSGDYAQINSRTATDGSAAVLLDGGATAGTGRGRLGAYKSEAFISWVVNDNPGGSQAGYSQTAVSCNGVGTINMWAQTAINLDLYSGTTLIADGHTYLCWKAGSGSQYCPTWTANAPGINAGIKFDSGIVSATINEGTAFGQMKATAFVVASTAATKTGIADIATVLPPLDTIRAAKSKAWKYKDDVDQHGEGARTRFGPVAEDLPAALVVMTPTAGGGLEPSISLGDQIGVLWAAVAHLADTVDALAGKTPKLPGGKP